MIKALYEAAEHRINGQTWALHELMLGFINDVGLFHLPRNPADDRGMDGWPSTRRARQTPRHLPSRTRQ